MFPNNLDVLRGFSFKIAARCNLNCSYCYVFNKGDSSWRRRPAIMPDDIFDSALGRIRDFCNETGRDSISITFHGGEPCLAGVERMDRWCQQVRTALDDVAKVRLTIQTNGTLLNSEWANLFRKHDISVGISMDGPKSIHDQYRLDHKGEGSYDSVIRGMSVLKEAGIDFSILSVINFDADPLEVHRHFSALGPHGISYLMPDFTHDTVQEVRRIYGETPCSDFLIPLFDEWWFNGYVDQLIQPFWSIAKMILGGDSNLDCFGNEPFGFLFIETDGTIEGLDVLRVCGDGFANTKYNIVQHSFNDFASSVGFNQSLIFQGHETPTACNKCVEASTCAGGYVPHRYGTINGFNNKSIWCKDILSLFSHIRNRLQVSAQESLLRRQALSDLEAM
ncbi:radical SAM protein [Bacillus cereus group sp. BfR-BA-01383]|uniref:radical SAM protein n=1 Tax=Bacillus cereus group sp. BfR-BA-01383 TaxID=2920327 RepID=UPI001F592C4B|nr:radical SAM protein [Bacillus cereus group sp. BfR-BA-01383]